MENFADINFILDELKNVHYPAGIDNQRLHRFQAKRCMETNHLETIYHLVESHAPGLRFRTIFCNDKNNSTLKRDHVRFSCTNSDNNENIERMLSHVEEMPKEWTIIQFTPDMNPDENFQIDFSKYYTNSMYLTVFNCGREKIKPFYVRIEEPTDHAGNTIELLNEMQFILKTNRDCLLSTKSQQFFKNRQEKNSYKDSRFATDQRLECLINDIQNVWLKEWRCLLIGKYINKDLDCLIRKEILEFFEKEAPELTLPDETTVNTLHCIVKGCSYLTLAELRRAVQFCFPKSKNKNLLKNLLQFIRNFSTEHDLVNEKRQPVILVVDDSLDCFPWEMIDVLKNEPVSRLPSLYMVYALFKQHESTIKDGHKIIKHYQNGSYIVNPNLDLKFMENRLMSFIKYWLPDWKGLAGEKPAEEEFEEILLSGDIFMYCGHGSGSQFFSMEKIQNNNIKAVVLLFGCSSSKLMNSGPQVEMYGVHHTYLIACSPCVVGMLWEITDVDVDVLTTEFMSTWIPSKAPIDWRRVKKEKWKKGESVDFSSQKATNNEKDSQTNHEPELLRALSLAKQYRFLTYNLTRAACVARGIPVRIEMS